MLYRRAIRGVLRSIIGVFSFAHGAYEAAVALLAIAGISTATYSAVNGNWTALLAVLLILVFIGAVRIQLQLNNLRHEHVFSIDMANSQVSMKPIHWKSALSDRESLKPISDSRIEVALNLRFRNRASRTMYFKNFKVSLHKNSIWLKSNRLETETSYALRERQNFSTKLNPQDGISLAADALSGDYYFIGFVTITKGMGYLKRAMPQPILIFSYRVDEDPKPHSIKIDIDWEKVWSEQLQPDTVLGYSDIC
jgi:hypothetical protein